MGRAPRSGRAAVALLVAGLACARAEPPPNVVVIVLDTLRADHLAPWGYDERVAPFLAGLARRSVVFTNAYSTSSWTAPATGSLFTGAYPLRHGLTRGFVAQAEQIEALRDEGRAEMSLTPLDAELRTLPMRLRELGFATYGLSANLNVGPELGFARGFDRFHRDTGDDAERLARRLESWRPEIRRRAPSFVYLHLNDAHKPYRKRAPFYRPPDDPARDAVARYDSEIRAIDDALAALWDAFGWERDTIVWILSDHGEEFGDHGGRGHGFTLYQELMRAVAIVHAPGLGAQRIDANVGLIDVLPTLLDQLGAAPPERGDGRSLLPLLRGGSEPLARALDERVLFGHRLARAGRREKWAALQRDWKLIRESGVEAPRLFDLRADPGETRDLAARHPEVVASLDAALDRVREREAPDGDAVAVPLDAETLEHLRELGYTAEPGEPAGAR